MRNLTSKSRKKSTKEKKDLETSVEKKWAVYRESIKGKKLVLVTHNKQGKKYPVKTWVLQ